MAAMAHIEAQPVPVRRSVVSRVKDALRPLEPWLPARDSSLSSRHAVQALRHHGFEPRTVFAVGVGSGTWGLYPPFPAPFYHLVDPTPPSLPPHPNLSRRPRR